MKNEYTFKNLVDTLTKIMDEDCERADSIIIFQYVSGNIDNIVEREIDVSRFMFLTGRTIIKMSDK